MHAHSTLSTGHQPLQQRQQAMPQSILGLDIGSASIKIAQIARHDDGTFTVERQAARPVPRGAIYDGHIDEKERLRVAQILADMVAEEKFSTRDVIFGLNSSASVFMDQMDIPVMDPADLDKAMPYLIEASQDGLNSHENGFSWSVVGEVETDHGPRLRVLVYRCFEQYAEETARVVEKAGLRVVGTDLNALAALRAISIQTRPLREVDAIVDIGANVLSLMLHHNGVPKTLTLDADNAGEVATQQVLEAMDLDEGQEDHAEFLKINDDHAFGIVAQARNAYTASLASRIAGVLRSAVERSDDIDAIASVTLVGGGALIAGLGHGLHEALGGVPLAFAAWDPAITDPQGGSPIRQEPRSGGDYLVAVGLGTGDVF